MFVVNLPVYILVTVTITHYSLLTLLLLPYVVVILGVTFVHCYFGYLTLLLLPHLLPLLLLLTV